MYGVKAESKVFPELKAIQWPENRRAARFHCITFLMMNKLRKMELPLPHIMDPQGQQLSVSDLHAIQ
jgi:hypothetical protein